MRLLQRLPAYALNGIAVALGIGLIQFLVTLLAGHAMALLALSGAVCASLADVPNTVPRTRSRVPVAGLLGVLAAAVVAALGPHPVALGFGIAGIAFVAMMTMAWGPRAGAVSFAPILSLVFTMAVPAGHVSPVHLVAWNAAGAAAYCVWSLLAGTVLQPRLRTLALVGAMRGTATLFATRAAVLRHPGGEAMRAWLASEAAVADRLQTARDFLFAAPDSPTARRHTAVLLALIDLRDLLLASRLDLDLLGDDAAGRAITERVADTLARLGRAVNAAALAWRDHVPLTPDLPAGSDLLSGVAIADDDPRRRLVPVLVARFDTLQSDVRRLQALLDGEPDGPPLSRAELQQFVAPEGWPLAALRDQFSGRSPVLRHAVRTALALGSAYAIARLLPWATHPHWLVLGVAVVLRGNLEQTLSRRNARVLGTLAGCVAVLGLAQLRSPVLLGAVFLVAVGIAHAFVLQRYWLTATAATVMALLQAHAVHPAGGFAIPERVADTLLGAALAWAFSYVLPSWERRHLPSTLARTLQALADYAALALTVPPPDGVAPRLARRRAYDALTALGGVMQRTGAEPASVQVPVAAVARVLDHGQRLMAHLSVVRMVLSRRHADLDTARLSAPLSRAQDAVAANLALRAADGGRGAGLGAGTGRGDVPGRGGSPERAGDAGAAPPGGLSTLPVGASASEVLPWLVRRLDVLAHDARCIQAAARDALAGPAR